MKNVYETIKDMPNPSQGLLKYFKRNPYKRIWAYRDHNKISDFTSLKKLKGLDLNGNLTLKVGSPSTMYRGDNSGGNVAKSRSFDGSHLVGHMFGQGFKRDTHLIGLGTTNKPIWMIDVTDQVIELLTTVGACSISAAHCKFELTSPKIKTCKFCGERMKKTIEIKKVVRWNRENLK